MQNRELIDRINFDTNEVLVDGKWYKLNDTYFPTIDKNEPSKLNEDEIQLMKKLKNSFKQSEKLQEHMRVLFTKEVLCIWRIILICYFMHVYL